MFISIVLNVGSKRFDITMPKLTRNRWKREKLDKRIPCTVVLMVTSQTKRWKTMKKIVIIS